ISERNLRNAGRNYHALCDWRDWLLSRVEQLDRRRRFEPLRFQRRCRAQCTPTGIQGFRGGAVQPDLREWGIDEFRSGDSWSDVLEAGLQIGRSGTRFITASPQHRLASKTVR